MRFKADQIKAFIKKEAQGNSTRSQIILRNYIMERFIERVALSQYKNNFILKGGMLIASIVGLDTRSTIDIDTTVKHLPLYVATIRDVISIIIAIPVDDGVSFTIKDISVIMDDSEYSGVRASLDAMLETIRTPLKIDISTGDAIIPKEISYDYKLMFEQRAISILAYNPETILAEKLETVLSRGTANTRLRDFYDIYLLQNSPNIPTTHESLKAAFMATCKKRYSQHILTDGTAILKEIEESLEMQKLWLNYQKKFDYADGISWEDVMDSTKHLFAVVISDTL